MSDQGFGHNDEVHGIVSNDSIRQEPWLERWWSVLVIGYVFLLAMFLLTITNQTWGR